MGNGKRSCSGGRTNWPVNLAGCVGADAGVALGFLVRALADLREVWPGMIVHAVCVGAGVVLGRLAGSLVFRRPPGNGPRD